MDRQIENIANGPFVAFCGFLNTAKNEIRLPSGLSIRYPDLRKVYTANRSEWIYTAWGKSKGQPEIVKLYGGKVLENISQALAGELCKEAARRCQLVNVTGTVHDEIHVLVPTELATSAIFQVQDIMEQAPKWMPRLKLKAEVAAGQNWLAAK